MMVTQERVEIPERSYPCGMNMALVDCYRSYGAISCFFTRIQYVVVHCAGLYGAERNW